MSLGSERTWLCSPSEIKRLLGTYFDETCVKTLVKVYETSCGSKVSKSLVQFVLEKFWNNVQMEVSILVFRLVQIRRGKVGCAIIPGSEILFLKQMERSINIWLDMTRHLSFVKSISNYRIYRMSSKLQTWTEIQYASLSMHLNHKWSSNISISIKNDPRCYSDEHHVHLDSRYLITNQIN